MGKDHSLTVWLLAARPKTLAAGMAPVIMGGALALGDGKFQVLAFACAFLGALLIQVGTNYANDYFDFVKGTDTAERVGPTRATQAGLVSPRTMLVATVLVFALALAPGGYLIYRGGWPILVIGVVSIACGVLYTGGPFPLGYLGLADVFVLVFFGPVAVAGTYYVQALGVTWESIAAGVAAGLWSTAILTVNNLRDMEGDARAGKRTLAVRFGRTFARLEYLFCILIAGIAIPVTLCFAGEGHTGALLAVWSVPPAIPSLMTMFSSTDGERLNNTLATTGKLLLLYAVLFSVGWLL